VTVRGATWTLAGFAATLAAGWILYPGLVYRQESQPMTFNHLVHTGESAGMRCDACHRMSDDGRFEGIPPLSVCAECHSEPLGTSEAENTLVGEFIRPQKEIGWKSYWRQPDNAWFSHSIHVTKAAIACTECHGDHGSSASLPALPVNRLSGYPAGVDRVSLTAVLGGAPVNMKMDRCTGCHGRSGVRTGCIACHK
jgi:hypothetical protein